MVPPREKLRAALEATWPAAHREAMGPFVWREGAGGGSRVSAATVDGAFSDSELTAVEERFAAHERPALFQVQEGDEALEAALEARGYRIKDPVHTLVLPLAQAPEPDFDLTYTSWPPLAVQREIWREDDIGPARLAVMERAAGPKTTLLARIGQVPVGTAFLGAHAGIVALHAVCVARAARRQGAGRALLAMAGHWARDQDAAWLALQVTRENTAALALYSSLGMTRVDGYHYRQKGPQ